MSVMFNRLTYILKKVGNINQASILTGIPYTTLYNYAKGLRGLPNKWENNLYNSYTRTSYASLRYAGLNSYQANRFRWYSPERVSIIEAEITTSVMEYARYALGQKAYREHILATEDFINDNLEKYMIEIKGKFAVTSITKEEYLVYLGKLLKTED